MRYVPATARSPPQFGGQRPPRRPFLNYGGKGKRARESLGPDLVTPFSFGLPVILLVGLRRSCLSVDVVSVRFWLFPWSPPRSISSSPSTNPSVATRAASFGRLSAG